jgi:hypothetical protein
VLRRIRPLLELHSRQTWEPALLRIRPLPVPVLSRIHQLQERGLYHTLPMPVLNQSHIRLQPPGLD